MMNLCIFAISAALYFQGFMSTATDVIGIVKENAIAKIEITKQEEAIKAETIKAESIKSELSLSGKIITIDAGHQRKGNSTLEQVAPNSTEKKAMVSSGTRGVFTGKYEYEINLEVAVKLRDKLEEHGATVYMVRETHDIDISNAQRAQFANDKGSDISIRIHADGSDNSSVRGFSILVPGDRYINNADIISKSNEAAKFMDATIAEATLTKSRGIVTRNDLTGFNWLNTPSVLIEMGFMSNKDDDILLSDEAFQHKMAEGITGGLIRYFNDIQQ